MDNEYDGNIIENKVKKIIELWTLMYTSIMKDWSGLKVTIVYSLNEAENNKNLFWIKLFYTSL